MRRAIGGVLAVVAVLAAGCGAAATPGSGEPDRAAPADTAPADEPTDALAAAEQLLGASFAGGFVDPSGQAVVLTTDPATTEEVRELGATPQVVEFSMAELQDWQQRVTTALGPQPPEAVTTWGVDVARNAVAVSVLAGEPVPPELQQVVDEAAGAVVLTEAAGPVMPLPAPGQG